MFMGDLTFMRALMLILRKVGTAYYINKIKTLKTITVKRFTVKVSVFVLKKRQIASFQPGMVWYAPFAGRSRSQFFTHTDFLLRFFFLFDITYSRKLMH